MADRTCTVVGKDGVPCPKAAAKNGMCAAHNAKVRKYGDPLAGRTYNTTGIKPICTARTPDPCDKPQSANELCNGHNQQQSQGKTLTPLRPQRRKSDDPVEWFLAGFDTSGGPDACHPWTRGTDGKTGYGKAQWQGKPERTHVIAWMIANNKKAPKGLDICHSCDPVNRLCGNPKHLRDDTHESNMDDMIRAGRSARGERHSQAKLTEDDVRAIRRRLAEGEICKSIAADFGVGREAINRIKNGRTWWWLTE